VNGEVVNSELVNGEVVKWEGSRDEGSVLFAEDHAFDGVSSETVHHLTRFTEWFRDDDVGLFANGNRAVRLL